MMMGKAQRIWRKSSASRACTRLLWQRCEISLLFVMSPRRMLWIRWRDSADFAPPLLFLLSLFHHHRGLCSFIIIFYKTVRSQMERERSSHSSTGAQTMTDIIRSFFFCHIVVVCECSKQRKLWHHCESCHVPSESRQTHQLWLLLEAAYNWWDVGLLSDEKASSTFKWHS